MSLGRQGFSGEVSLAWLEPGPVMPRSGSPGGRGRHGHPEVAGACLERGAISAEEGTACSRAAVLVLGSGSVV